MNAKSIELQSIRQHCKTLRMPSVATQFQKIAEQAQRDEHSYVRYLDVLLSAEVEEREYRAVQRRLVLSIRRECLDRFVPLNERHLRTAITKYVVHYHTERNHQGLGNELITPLPASANDAGPIVSRERLGGILNYYCRAA